jgi:hypothetical protein
VCSWPRDSNIWSADVSLSPMPALFYFAALLTTIFSFLFLPLHLFLGPYSPYSPYLLLLDSMSLVLHLLQFFSFFLLNNLHSHVFIWTTGRGAAEWRSNGWLKGGWEESGSYGTYISQKNFGRLRAF